MATLSTLAALLLAQLGNTAKLDPIEQGRQAFVRGRYPEAQKLYGSCLKTRPKQCPPLLRALVLYQPLAARADELTPEEAAQLVALDRVITAGGEPAGRTHQALERYVDLPLRRGRAALEGGSPARAAQLAREVLVVDPKNEAAQALLAAAGADAGTLRAGGRDAGPSVAGPSAGRRDGGPSAGLPLRRDGGPAD